ncbi:Major facilitator superfamily transporter [Metarhizium robertsii ARSEF 23]|uniref:Major facilitator superfamily transporter n=1 Tax=Metarhizium robertsii (strain ARSEF 23 / ATCC MYA-3075) TaxID=655844 RepID=E9F3H3_METRA|nr:Major facilitator superfamily transporter [Metarhizium robertsii ARSEF 23]EFY97710.1 Major facilitator superfamily transporter [Metarhizium robertsii ARSEF 23]
MEHRTDETDVPGTTNVLLKTKVNNVSDKVVLHPVPTTDPNDPLNWSSLRKTVNYGLVQIYVLFTFVQLDIGFTAWNQYQEELGLSVGTLNGATALNYAGLAVGSFLFIPLMHKYGRRPLYIVSTMLQLASCVWFARANTQADMWLANLVSGLGGAVCETVVQVTICDIFFIHQHAVMNAVYLLFTSVGAFLGPVAAGYIVDSQGWRWMWWWCVIFFGVNLLLVVFFFEESKYVGAIQGQPVADTASIRDVVKTDTDSRHVEEKAYKSDFRISEDDVQRTESRSYIDGSIPMKSYRERMRLVTRTDESILRHMHEPFPVLFTFPAVAFTAITYGSMLAVFAILVSVQAIYLFSPPYNFSAAGVGLMNIAPFVGTIPGVFIGGTLNDKSIVWLSRRNGGVYEPEMRLWLALPCAIAGPAGVLLLGVGLANGVAWPLLAVGFGLFGFTLTVAGSIALSYAMDCYHDIVGSSMIGIIFTRNVLSVVVLFALTPWIESMGLQNVHILVAGILGLILLIPVLLLKWGKKARARSAKAYRAMAARQSTSREL